MNHLRSIFVKFENRMAAFNLVCHAKSGNVKVSG